MGHASPPSFLYFDLGNVLLSFTHERMCRQMAAAAGVSPALVREALFESQSPSVQWQFERGDFDALALYARFCEAVGARPDRDALFAAASDIFEEIPGSVAIVERLAAAGRRLGILSNTNPVDWEYIVSGRFPFIRRCFEQYVRSYEVQAMKPDRAIFDAAVRRAGVPAGEVFFTDDRPENVEGALAAGLDAALFTSPAGLGAELARRGV